MNANVTVTVQRIPKEAVIQSGSVRLDVSPETFISEENGRERLTHLLKARVDTEVFFTFYEYLFEYCTLVHISSHFPLYSKEKWVRNRVFSFFAFS